MLGQNGVLQADLEPTFPPRVHQRTEKSFAEASTASVHRKHTHTHTNSRKEMVLSLARVIIAAMANSGQC